MAPELDILVVTAFSLGFFHTILGPDHYVPFVAMAKAGQWSRSKTLWITILCGVGHVGSSIVLGFIGISFGWAAGRLEMFESHRGNIAGWLLVGFGLLYTIWGIRRAIRNRPHTHFHTHGDEIVHTHGHRHSQDHMHVHAQTAGASMTPWILFTIFIFGPCEPLIPLLMYPAAQHHLFDVVVVSCVFGAVTVGTMLFVVLGSLAGLHRIPIPALARYSHAVAGASILMSGIVIQFFGL